MLGQRNWPDVVVHILYLLLLDFYLFMASISPVVTPSSDTDQTSHSAVGFRVFSIFAALICNKNTWLWMVFEDTSSTVTQPQDVAYEPVSTSLLLVDWMHALIYSFRLFELNILC